MPTRTCCYSHFYAMHPRTIPGTRTPLASTCGGTGLVGYHVTAMQTPYTKKTCTDARQYMRTHKHAHARSSMGARICGVHILTHNKRTRYENATDEHLWRHWASRLPGPPPPTSSYAGCMCFFTAVCIPGCVHERKCVCCAVGETWWMPLPPRLPKYTHTIRFPFPAPSHVHTPCLLYTSPSPRD